MAAHDNLIKLIENVMARRWWTNKTKRELDPYSAAVLNICVEAVNKKRDLQIHPLIQSILRDETDVYFSKIDQQNNVCFIIGFDDEDDRKGLLENLHGSRTFCSDYHESSMPDIWCGCCCKDATLSKDPKVVAQQNIEREYSLWDFTENPLLALNSEEGNCQLETHFKDYRKYVNRLCSGGWYTTKVNDSQPQSHLDHLYIRPLRKALTDQTFKEYEVDGKVPDWLYKLHQPEIKAIWSDESDLESDSDHDLILNDHRPQLLEVDVPSCTTDGMTELSEDSRARNWFNLECQHDLPKPETAFKQSNQGSNQTVNTVPLMEWKCLSDANKCLNQAHSVLCGHSATAPNILQCSVAQVPPYLLHSQNQEPAPIQNAIGQPVQEEIPIHYPLQYGYNSNNADITAPGSASQSFKVCENCSSVTLPPKNPHRTENENTKPVQILQRKPKSFSNWDKRPEDTHLQPTDSEPIVNICNKDDNQRLRSFQGFNSLPAVHSEPVLPLSAYLLPRSPTINLYRTKNATSVNINPEKEAMGDSDTRKQQPKQDIPQTSKVEKTSVTESQSASIQMRPARGSRSGRLKLPITPGQWASMWPASMPTRSTFGSQVVQYNSMGRPMRINLPKQQSIRITPSSSHLHQQPQSQPVRSHHGLATPAQQHNQTKLSNSMSTTPIPQSIQSAPTQNFVMTSTARRPRQLTSGRQRANLIQIPLQDNDANSRVPVKETPLKSSASMPAVSTPMQQYYNYNTEYPPLRQTVASSLHSNGETSMLRHREGLEQYFIHSCNPHSEYHAREKWPTIQEVHSHTTPTISQVQSSPWVQRTNQNMTNLMAQRNLNADTNSNNNNGNLCDRPIRKDTSLNAMKYNNRICDKSNHVPNSVKIYKVLVRSFQNDRESLMSPLLMPKVSFSHRGME